MANYNRSHFKMVDGKPVGNEMINMKTGRTEKAFSYKEAMENPMKSEKYKSTQMRRKELNEERIFPPKSGNDMTSEEKMRENLMKNKAYNEKMKNKTYNSSSNVMSGNNNAEMKKKMYYEKLPNNASSYDEYRNAPNHFVGDNMGPKNVNKNYMDRKGYDENTIMKERSKYRRIEGYNEEGNLHANNTNDAVMYKDVNINAPSHRNYNDYSKPMSNNKDMLLKNVKPGIDRDHFTKGTFKGNYEFNEKGYEPYEGNYNKSGMPFPKSKEYNNYVPNDGNMKYPKGNMRNAKMFSPKEANDPMGAEQVTSVTAATTGTASGQRDLAYRRHVGNEANIGDGKDVSKGEQLLNKEGLVLEDQRGEGAYYENDMKADMRVLNNANKDFSRSKSIMPPKNMTKSIAKNVITAPSSASTDMTMMGLNRKASPASIYKENMSNERNANSNLAMYKNSSIRPSTVGTAAGNDMYSQKYPSKPGDMNKSVHGKVSEKEGNRGIEGIAEHHNESLSTIDSNQSSTNVFETIYPKAPNLLETHVKPIRSENAMVDGIAKGGEYSKEDKLKKDMEHKGMVVSRNYLYAQEYDYNYKKEVSKRSFKMDDTAKGLGSVEKVPLQEGREKVGLDEKESHMGKKYEYGDHTNRDREVSPEFGKDCHVNSVAGGSNANDLGNNNHVYEGRGENKMMKGNVGLENPRDYKGNTNRYGPYDSPPCDSPAYDSPSYESSPYDSPTYEEKMLRKQANINAVNDAGFSNKNMMRYAKPSDDEYGKYRSSGSYDGKPIFIPDREDIMEKEYIRNEKGDYYGSNTGYNKMGYKYKEDRNERSERNDRNERIERVERNERNMGRPVMVMDSHINRAKENYKGRKYINNSNYKNYHPNCYIDEEEMPGVGHAYGYRNDPYGNAGNTEMKHNEDIRAYGGNYSYDSPDERKGSLTVVRLPAENRKQVKMKKKRSVGSSSNVSIVDIYSTAVPLSDHADSYVVKALSQDESIDDSIYALIPKSVKEVIESDDVTHVTLNSPASLFVNPNLNVKQHILTSNYQEENNSGESSPCVFPLSEDQLKERSGIEGEKNLKSIIRGTSLRNKSGSSLSVKFKLGDTDRDKKEGKKSVIAGDDADGPKDLLKKIENYIPEEIKNIKIDKQTTEKRRASIFDESKEKSKNAKKKDFSNKIVLDSNKVKKATEIKLKRVQEVTGLFEKYGIPNPFETFYMEEINYKQLLGLTEEAKLFNLALTVSSNYCKFIRRRLDRAEENRVFNEKRKMMFIKVVELLGQQINTEIKKKFTEVNVPAPISEGTHKAEIMKHHMNAKEREIKVEEHNLVCKYWDKQSECMGLLIKEWNKICEILESLNIDPNNIINSLTSIYGEQAVMEYQLSADEIATKTIELDVDLEDLSIPNWGAMEHMEEMFDPSAMTVPKLIQDIKWDMDIEYSLNQIRVEWTNQNKLKKKRVQKKIIEGIKHRVELIDYLNNIELNLNAFAKLIEKRIISKDDVKSQLMSMQDFQETNALANALKKLKSDRNELLSESGKTPASFFTTHHFPLTNSTASENSQNGDKQEMKEGKEKKEKKEKKETKEKKEIEVDGEGEEQKTEKSENDPNLQNEETTEVQKMVENSDISEHEEAEEDKNQR